LARLLLKPLISKVTPTSIPNVELMNGGLPSSITDSLLLKLRFKTDSKAAKATTTDSEMLK
jgi:hypothetical protein